MALSCVDTMMFGQVCDACDGGAIFKIVSFFLKTVSMGVLVLAVIGIIICGVTILTAGSEPAKVARGKRRLIETVIGIVVYALMFTIINFIIPGGVVTSSLDTSTTSCPETKLPESTKGERGKEKEKEEGEDDPPSGEGEDDDIHQSESDLGGEKAPYFLSDPITKCPKNTKHSGSGTMVAYTEGEHAGWSFVNTPIDVIKYSEYLQANHISMDGKTCKTNGECAKTSSIGIGYYNDDGNCEKFAPTFAGNLYGNACISNDAFASHMGRTDKRMFSSTIWLQNNKKPGSGEFTDTGKKLVDRVYFDPRMNFDSAGKSNSVYSGGQAGFRTDKCALSKRIFEEMVDHARPVVARVRGGTGHWAVGVGLRTSKVEDYKAGKKGSDWCSVPLLEGSDLVYLNTDGVIYHDQKKFWSGWNTSSGYLLMTCGKDCT